MSKHSVECLVMIRAIWNIQKVGLGNASSTRWHIDKITYFQHILSKNPHHHQTVQMVSKTLYCELQKCWWNTTNRLRPWNPDHGKRSIFMGERQSSALVLLKKSLRSRIINDSLKLRGPVNVICEYEAQHLTQIFHYIWRQCRSTFTVYPSLNSSYGFDKRGFMRLWRRVVKLIQCAFVLLNL